jgi:selenide,water dikinase
LRQQGGGVRVDGDHGRLAASGRSARARRFPDGRRRGRCTGGPTDRRSCRPSISFTPIVDDPYDFGQIAAANAMSDVYAMGGQPRTALAITALPKDGPPADVIREIFRGGADLLKVAGVSLLGGHTVTDPEIKFGYSITGEVDPDRILTNATARTGDVLFLTKSLGTGIVVRARRYGQGSDEYLDAAVQSMKTLNDAPARVAA